MGLEKTRAGYPVDVVGILEAETWDIRIIDLSLETNEMSIYHREHQTVVEAGDLLQFILGGFYNHGYLERENTKQALYAID